MACNLADSHKWVEIPHTVYERRRELRVRECRQTVMVHDRKYYDSDNMKFDSDRIETINSYQLSEFDHATYDVNWHVPSHSFRRRMRERNREIEKQSNGNYYSPIFNIPKFVPKDDEFDIEESDYQTKRENYDSYANRKAKELAYEQKKIEEERKQLEAREAEYQANLLRNERQISEVRARIKAKNKQLTTFSKNTWIPK